MSVTEKTVGLNTKVEPRGPGTMTESGLLKLADGTLMARHGTDSGAREGSDVVVDDKIATAEAQMAELEALAKKAPKRTRKKVQEPKAETSMEPVSETVNVMGLGDIRTQYSQVQIGTGMAMLGLTSMSFVPQTAVRMEDGSLSPILRLGSAPDKRYIYVGNQIIDRYGTTNIFLIELPEEA